MLVTDAVTLTDLPIICWDNNVTVANLSADTEDPDFPISNASNPSTGLKWKQDFTGSPAAADAIISISLGVNSGVNYIGIAGHNFGSAAISVAVSTTDSPLSDLIAEFTPTDDDPLILIFNTSEVEESGGDITIRMQTGATAAEIAVIYAGTYTVFEEGIQADHTPLPLANEIEIVNGRSENGQFLGRITIGSQARSAASFANLSKAWVRSDLMPFLEFAAENPFFYAWSPLTYPDETAFAWLDGSPNPVFDIDGFGAIDLSMAGIVV